MMYPIWMPTWAWISLRSWSHMRVLYSSKLLRTFVISRLTAIVLLILFCIAIVYVALAVARYGYVRRKLIVKLDQENLDVKTLLQEVRTMIRAHKFTLSSRCLSKTIAYNYPKNHTSTFSKSTLFLISMHLISTLRLKSSLSTLSASDLLVTIIFRAKRRFITILA